MLPHPHHIGSLRFDCQMSKGGMIYQKHKVYKLYKLYTLIFLFYFVVIYSLSIICYNTTCKIYLKYASNWNKINQKK